MGKGEKGEINNKWRWETILETLIKYKWYSAQVRKSVQWWILWCND